MSMTTIRPFKKEEVAKVPNRPGLYAFFNRQKGIIYVGTSQVLRHRLQSYYQDDDFGAHPTKEKLREKIAYFIAEEMDLCKARELEEEIKCKMEYNYR